MRRSISVALLVMGCLTGGTEEVHEPEVVEEEVLIQCSTIAGDLLFDTPEDSQLYQDATAFLNTLPKLTEQGCWDAAEEWWDTWEGWDVPQDEDEHDHQDHCEE